MGEIERKPPTEVIIEASIINTSPEKKHSFSINNAAEPYPSSILTRLHAGYFRISLSVGGQAMLWKILTEPNGTVSQDVWQLFLKVPSSVCLVLWCLAILTQISLSFVYILRCFFHFHLVKAEFVHHIGVNYFYAPWISWLILLQSAPTLFPNTSIYYLVLCWIFIVPLAMLDIKIYGQWFTTEKRFLSIMANPTSQISVIGNFVAARAAAKMGWKESAICMWSLGVVHYLVLFVTLYQRLSGGNSLPLILRPTFFLFIAAPSMASLAWNSITGAFDTTSKMLFFFSVFLFMSLACRPSLFKKSMRKFNVAWWAYSFPLTFLAMAAAEYAQEVKGHVATVLMLVLSALSVLVFLGLMMLAAVNTDQLLGKTDPIVSFSDNQKSST
ncbi:S-type anion channel SLAH4-like [Durio zibethinus]|uniref:S-type anion channel SLAH4-like n=1 Tax=Durio zibethinus TaxID=66656 RepID=A0A6P5WJK5_DURZI|nr:S-type anion channel SLAH4-like [Durio zibethinus]